MNRLDADEKEILEAFESGRLKPYQTLVSSVLHKFIEGKMVEQPADKDLQRPR